MKQLPIVYLTNIDGYVLVFSLNDNISFETIQHVNRLILAHVGAKFIPRVVVGTKLNSKQASLVSNQRIHKFCDLIKAPYVECVGLETQQAVNSIFNHLLEEINKERNDKYPYDIKNTARELTYIRQNHRVFRLILSLIFLLICVNKTAYLS